jgi:hypothetical protein
MFNFSMNIDKTKKDESYVYDIGMELRHEMIAL